MRTGSMRVTKREWYTRGGFKNPRCWRRQTGWAWNYYFRWD